MPIPIFSKAGLLPPGVHHATIDEVEERFGRGSSRRTKLYAKLARFLAEVRSFQIFDSIFIDGSFVTDKPNPGDIDVVLVGPSDQLRLFATRGDAMRLDPHRIKREYEVHLFIQPPPHRMTDFFQTIRAEDALERNVPPHTKRGIIEVTL